MKGFPLKVLFLSHMLFSVQFWSGARVRRALFYGYYLSSNDHHPSLRFRSRLVFHCASVRLGAGRLRFKPRRGFDDEGV